MANLDEILLAIRADNKDLLLKMESSQKAIEKLSKKTSKSTEAMSSAFKKFAAIAIAKISIDTAKYFVKLAGDLDSVSSSFNNLAKNAEGGSKALLKSIKEASKGTVSELEIMRSSNLAIQLMGEDVTKQLPQMMAVARAAARTQGVEVQQMYNDIIVASGRQSVMILDNLGISSSVARKYQDEYAASLGKTSQQLTDQEKAAGFFFAVMKAGGELIENAGADSLSLGERLQIIDAKVQDAAASIAQQLTPGLETLMDVLVDTDVNFEDTILGTLVDGLNDIIVLFSRAVLQVKNFGTSMRQTWRDIKDTVSTNGNVVKRSRTEQQLEQMKPAEAAKWMKAHRKEMMDMGFNEDYIEGSIKMVSATANYSGNRDRTKEKKGTGAGTKPKAPGDVPGAGGKPASESQYLSYIGDEKGAELAKLKENYDQMVAAHQNNKDQLAAIDLAYDKKRRELEEQYSLFTMENGLKMLDAASGMVGQLGQLYSQESNNKLARLDAAYQKEKEYIEKNVTDEDDKKAQLEKLEEQYEAKKRKEQLKAFKREKKFNIAEVLMSIPKMAADAYKALVGIPYIGPVLAVAAAVAATGFGFAQVKNIKEQEPPVFAKGYVPDDHELAYISRKEAIVNAASTRANYELLSMMNANPGVSISPASQGSQSIPGGDVYIDSYYFGQWVARATEDGRMRIHPNGISA